MNYKLEEILPHSNGMILIDQVENFAEDSLNGKVKISRSSKFLNHKNQVPAWVGIEYMAQTIAAWAGIHAKLVGKPITLGFLLGSRRYHSKVSYFNLDDELTIFATRSYQHENLGVFDCEILHQDTAIIDAKLSVYQQ